MASLTLVSGTLMQTARCTDTITRSHIHRVIRIHTIMTTRMVTATHMITHTATTTPTTQNTR